MKINMDLNRLACADADQCVANCRLAGHDPKPA